MMRVPVEISARVQRNDILSRYNVSEVPKTFWMLAVNEIGIYEALIASTRLEARKFRRWSASVMQKPRSRVSLEGYEVMRMTDKDIDHILDTLSWYAVSDGAKAETSNRCRLNEKGTP